MFYKNRKEGYYEKFVKLFASSLLLFTMLFSMGVFTADAAGKDSKSEITPEVVMYCPYGPKHRPASRVLFAKVKVDGDSTLYNFSRVTCQCGDELFYDGYPSLGFVGNYFSNYYDTYIDWNLNMTIFEVHLSDIHSEYNSPNLVDWQLTN